MLSLDFSHCFRGGLGGRSLFALRRKSALESREPVKFAGGEGLLILLSTVGGGIIDSRCCIDKSACLLSEPDGATVPPGPGTVVAIPVVAAHPLPDPFCPSNT